MFMQNKEGLSLHKLANASIIAYDPWIYYEVLLVGEWNLYVDIFVFFFIYFQDLAFWKQHNLSLLIGYHQQAQKMVSN